MHQLRKLVSSLNLAQRITIVLVALAAGAGITAFVHFHHEGDFRPLYTSMAPEDAATVVQKLRETGVEYRLAENGASVLVPSAKLAESRLALAAAGLPKTGRIGFELFDKTNFGATEFVEHINYKRALEGELERSVMSLGEVEQSRVHLTLPKESVFLDQQQPAKASVMIKLRPGAQVSPQNVLAVTHLVASAVEGLTPEAVTVVDMDGNLLSRPKRSGADEGAGVPSETLELRQQMERSLVAKISETLEPLLGPDGFRAGASVDCDFTSGDQQEETFDPTRSVMQSSQKSEDSSDHGIAAAGIPGIASNLPNPASRPAKTSDGSSRRTENITYQTSRVVRHTLVPRGVVRSMSLAVLVGQTVRWDGAGLQKQRVLVPPSPETLKSIRELVTGITGFNATRGDQLIVETLPFESSVNAQQPVAQRPAVTPTAPEPPWLPFVNRYRDLWAPAAIALAVLGVLARVLFRLRRGRRPVEAEIQAAEELQAGALLPALAAPESVRGIATIAGALSAGSPSQAGDPIQLAERVRDLARREPAVTANVLRMWLQESKPS
jgi:flagellar M-ring protein FliF